MYKCPSCESDTISALARMNATPMFPAVCPKCGARSHPSAWARGLNVLSWEILFWGSIVAALLLRSWWALLLFPLGLWICGRLIGSMFALRSIDAAGVRSARRRILFEVLIIAAVVAVAASITEGWPSP